MATVITDSIKKDLMSRGIWGDFVRRREDLSMTEGLSGFRASRKAIEELAPDLYELVLPRGRPSKKNKKLEKESSEKESPRQDKRELRFENTLSDISKKEDLTAEKIDDSIFAGKSCSESVAIDWAFVRSQLGTADAADAPSEKAWAYYMLFTKSPSAMVEIVKANAIKRVAKEDVTDGREMFDGESEYDLLRAIAEGAVE